MGKKKVLKYRFLKPHECGWMGIGPRTWELPNGKYYVFSPDMPEVVAILDQEENEK